MGMVPLEDSVDPFKLSITQRAVGRAAALLVTLETNLGQENPGHPNISKYRIIGF